MTMNESQRISQNEWNKMNEPTNQCIRHKSNQIKSNKWINKWIHIQWIDEWK